MNVSIISELHLISVAANEVLQERVPECGILSACVVDGKHEIGVGWTLFYIYEK